jgi:hypothetical protein
MKPCATDGRLRRALVEAAHDGGQSMSDLTVLASQNDPFRRDTPAGHRGGAWLAARIDELGLGERPIHLRGLHYAVIGQPKPNGQPYANSDTDWQWLSCAAAKAARWLGYVPFEQIVDHRNTPPTVRIHTKPVAEPYLSVGIEVDRPDAADLAPTVDVEDFDGEQPCKLVIFGEKSSLADVLEPFAREYAADLYLMTGEISDTYMHQMAQIGADDGRPMVVLCFADCDPAGWQMSVSIGRKLQALRELLFDDLAFEVHRVGLTPDQVRELGLPSTPLKDTERRADRWQAEMGVQQTEIDALAALRPEILRQMARAAIDPFWDPTLDMRVWEARSAWRREAQAVVDETIDADDLDRIQDQARERLDELQAEIDALNDAVRIDPLDFDLPPIVVPVARRGEAHGNPLVDSRWPFVEQCRRLKASKGYLE